MHRRRPQRILTQFAVLALAGAVLAAPAGCERRVVSESYGPMTGFDSYGSKPIRERDLREPAPARSDPVGDVLKGTTDLLFGWTKVFDSKPEPAKPKSQPPWDQVGGQTTMGTQ